MFETTTSADNVMNYLNTSSIYSCSEPRFVLQKVFNRNNGKSVVTAYQAASNQLQLLDY
jgi:hypothetical protein